MSTQGASAEAKPATCLQKMSHAIESRMHSFFSRLGELVAIHPGKTVLLAVIGMSLRWRGVGWGGVRRGTSRGKLMKRSLRYWSMVFVEELGLM